jgi:glycine hydroxymethyltransferase
VFARERGCTSSHQLAIEAAIWGGGQSAARRLEQARLLACGIGLPIGPVPGDVNGLRLGVPEIVRLGMQPADMAELGQLIARALGAGGEPERVGLAQEVSTFRRRFKGLHHMRL